MSLTSTASSRLARPLAATLAALLALVLALTVFSPPATAAPPAPGPVFAVPGGQRTPAGTISNGTQITDLLVRNVDGAPRGSVIRFATALTDRGLTSALIRAHRRGVHVRAVIPTHSTRGCGTSQPRRLGNAIGRNIRGKSWMKCIRGSARNNPAAGGHMHMKVWSFSRTGGRQHVVVVTSQNATENAKQTQWNDAYQSVGWGELYHSWVSLFNELKKDAGGSFWQRSWGASGAYATPVAASNDPIVRRINAIPAQGSRIRVAMSAISYGNSASDRPVRIARALIAKKRQGADIAILYTHTLGKQAPYAVRLMRQNGIPVKAFVNDRPYVHHKFMTATYLEGGTRVYRVWTGSEEWKQSSYGQDEFVLQLAGKGTVQAYVGFWTYLRDTLARR